MQKEVEMDSRCARDRGSEGQSLLLLGLPEPQALRGPVPLFPRLGQAVSHGGGQSWSPCISHSVIAAAATHATIRRFKSLKRRVTEAAMPSPSATPHSTLQTDATSLHPELGKGPPLKPETPTGSSCV